MSSQEHTSPQREDPHLQLGSLLQKPRSARKKHQVEEILQGDFSVTEKITRIKALDHKPEPVSQAELPKKQEQVEPLTASDFQAGEEQQQSIEKTRRNQTKVKRSIAPTRFWSFLLFEYRGIRRYADESKVLATGLFPFTIKLDRSTVLKLEDSIKPAAGQVAEMLQPMLKTSWLYLTKHDYNLVVVLHRMCLAITGVRTTGLSRSGHELHTRLKDVECLYLSLYRESEQFVRLYWTIRQYQKHTDQNAPETRKHLLHYVRRLLHRNPAGPTITDLILGLNMLQTRRYLEIEQLIHPDTGTLISHQEFDCSDSVRDSIAEYLTRLERTIRPLMHQYSKITRIRRYLPRSSDADDEYTLLSSWYEQHSTADQNRQPVVFSADEKNIMVFVPRVIQFLLQDISPLLTEALAASTAQRVRLIRPTVCSAEIDRLVLLQDKFERLRFQTSRLATTRYHNIKHNKSQAVAYEAEVCYLTDSVFSLCMNLARLIMTELDGDELQNMLREEIVLLEPSVFSGRNAHRALQYAVMLLLLLAKWNDHPELILLLRKEAEISDELRSQLSVFERIAHHTLYARIREQIRVLHQVT